MLISGSEEVREGVGRVAAGGGATVAVGFSPSSKESLFYVTTDEVSIKWARKSYDIYVQTLRIVPSKLLTSTLTPNFDRGSYTFFKNCICFMAQEWASLSKANKSGIFLEMQKKLKVGVTVSFVHFSSCWF
jgi:hypothetical protein